jgi:hypothetical protein
MVLPRVSTLDMNSLDAIENSHIDRGFGTINED